MACRYRCAGPCPGRSCTGYKSPQRRARSPPCDCRGGSATVGAGAGSIRKSARLGTASHGRLAAPPCLGARSVEPPFRCGAVCGPSGFRSGKRSDVTGPAGIRRRHGGHPAAKRPTGCAPPQRSFSGWRPIRRRAVCGPSGFRSGTGSVVTSPAGVRSGHGGHPATDGPTTCSARQRNVSGWRPFRRRAVCDAFGIRSRVGRDVTSPSGVRSEPCRCPEKDGQVVLPPRR